jgi:glucose/arabinose dehydrogenase
VVASGLENPWAVAFIGNGDMLVTERPGRLRLVNAKGQVSEPISGLPAIQAGRQGGLLDLITDSDFKSNRTLYFCYTAPDLESPSSGANTTALASTAFGNAAVAEMKKSFPGADVDHAVFAGDVAKSVEIAEYDIEEYEETLDEAQRVIEAVYETGLFWA